MAWALFWGSLFVISYTFAGYPLILFAGGVLARRRVRRGSVEPTVAVIVPVHNGEGLIRKKLDNCLAFDYPREKLRILVASDGSTDRTTEIAAEYASQGVELVAVPRRVGKVGAQNAAVRGVGSEIVIFTDLAITMRPDAVRRVVENFADPEVGVVSCRDHVVEGESGGWGERSYIRYDMLVRRFASRVGSLIGVTGGFYAVRRELVQEDWDPAFPPDFFVALHGIRNGFRVVEDDRVIAYYGTAAKGWDEFPRKVRTLNRGMHAFFSHGRLLNPRRYGLVSFQLLSHKLLRWLTPLWLASGFLGSLALAGRSGFAAVLFAVQIVVYGTAAVAFLLGSRGPPRFPFKQAQYFLVANLAIVVAWLEFAGGKRYVAWEPTKR